MSIFSLGIYKTFVFNSKGLIIAHPLLREIKAYKKFKQIPNVQSLLDPVLLAIYNNISLGRKDIQDIEVDGMKWLVSIAINIKIGAINSEITARIKVGASPMPIGLAKLKSPSINLLNLLRPWP